MPHARERLREEPVQGWEEGYAAILRELAFDELQEERRQGRRTWPADLPPPRPPAAAEELSQT